MDRRKVCFIHGGPYEISPGDIITGAESGNTAKIVRVDLLRGSWPGGDAAAAVGSTRTAAILAERAAR